MASAVRLADRVRKSGLLDDTGFDALLSEKARRHSERFWTPVAVAKRAAALFREHGVRSVLDVGSGVGKFCIVAACAEPELSLTGVEQRPELVRDANRLARSFDANTTRFALGDALEIPWRPFQGLYFFNPFAENSLAGDSPYDTRVELSWLRMERELIHTEYLLSEAAVGTVLITYRSLGGPIPANFAPVHAEAVGTYVLRVWQRRDLSRENWCWLDMGGDIARIRRNTIYDALTYRSRIEAGRHQPIRTTGP